EQSLITVESDKASMEIPASAGGVVKSIKVKVGDKVSQGSALVEVEPVEGGQGEAEPEAGKDAEPAQPQAGQAPAGQAPAQQAAPAQGGVVAVEVPDIGDFKEVEVIEVMVAEGDTIKPEQSLITVESDKASMEIPASTGGVVKSVKVKVGDKVSKGSVILEVQAEGAAEQPAS